MCEIKFHGNELWVEGINDIGEGVNSMIFQPNYENSAYIDFCNICERVINPNRSSMESMKKSDIEIEIENIDSDEYLIPMLEQLLSYSNIYRSAWSLGFTYNLDYVTYDDRHIISRTTIQHLTGLTTPQFYNRGRKNAYCTKNAIIISAKYLDYYLTEMYKKIFYNRPRTQILRHILCRVIDVIDYDELANIEEGFVLIFKRNIENILKGKRKGDKSGSINNSSTIIRRDSNNWRFNTRYSDDNMVSFI